MLTEETAVRIVDARRHFTEADEAIYGAKALGREREAVETLLRARLEYHNAIAAGERELGLEAR